MVPSRRTPARSDTPRLPQCRYWTATQDGRTDLTRIEPIKFCVYVLNHPLIFLIVKSMPYLQWATGCYRHNRFMVVVPDSFLMAATTYRPTFGDRCRQTSHSEASRSKK